MISRLIKQVNTWYTNNSIAGIVVQLVETYYVVANASWKDILKGVMKVSNHRSWKILCADDSSWEINIRVAVMAVIAWLLHLQLPIQSVLML